MQMDKIDRPDEPDRVEIDEAELAELRQSIEERGQLSPIQVNRKGGRYQIVFGDRRFLAVKSLGWSKIQAIVVEYSEEDMFIDRATENVQRKNLSPVEEALTYRRLIEKCELGVAEIGKRMGISAGTVKRRMSVLKMPDAFQVALHGGRMSLSVAEELWSCPDAAHREYLCQLAVEHGVTSMVARQWVQDWKKAQAVVQNEVEPFSQEPSPMEGSPIYRACDLCRDPVELKDLREIRCCPGCMAAIIGAAKKGG